VERVWGALAAGGRVLARPRAGSSRCARVCDGGRRPRIWAPESQNHGEKPAPPAGALQRGDGPGRVVCRRLLLVVAFVLDPSSLSSPGGNQPVLAVSSRITRCCGPAPSGLTPPGRAGWQSPPTATRDPGPHPCGVDGSTWCAQAAVTWRAPERGNTSHRWGCPGFLVAVGGACTIIADWRCPAGRFGTTAACDSAGHRQSAMIPSGRRQRRGTRDKGDHNTDRHQTARPRPTPRCRAPAGGAGLSPWV